MARDRTGSTTSINIDAPVLKICCTQGDIRELNIDWNDADGTAISISDSSVYQSITAQANIGGNLVGLAPTLSDDTIKILTAGKATAGETIETGNPKSYDFDIQVVLVNGQSQTIVKGQFEVSNQVVSQTYAADPHSTLIIADGSTS